MLGLGRGEIKWGRDWSNSGFGIILGWREGGGRRGCTRSVVTASYLSEYKIMNYYPCIYI